MSASRGHPVFRMKKSGTAEAMLSSLSLSADREEAEAFFILPESNQFLMEVSHANRERTAAYRFPDCA